MIVGTAGHIDHGKTALIRALTGVDTDRLKEEKARGISIDLGYAYLPAPTGEILGFIDVPGHEKFVHNMLAGATGIDYALLVVAADDGVMPQTREHLAIVDLLGISRGIIALTKVDLVSTERRAEVASEIEETLRATALRGAEIVPVSAVSGENVDALREKLFEAAKPSRRETAGRFRLAVDRCFTLSGIGTVVTGTVLSGPVSVGDHVTVSPSGIAARVRSIHAQNQPAQRGQSGERCALNLTGDGVSKDAISRGDVVLDPALHAPADRIDADLRLLASEAKPITTWMPARLHHGAGEVAVRVVVLQDTPIAPGAAGRVQLVLEQPIAAAEGDRFILRDTSAQRTLGGGRFLDLRAPARRRKTPERLKQLDAHAERDHDRALAALLQCPPGFVDVAVFARDRVLTPQELAEVLKKTGAALLGADERMAVALQTRRILGEQVQSALKQFHAANPSARGIAADRLRRELPARIPAECFQALIQTLAKADEISLEGGAVSARDHAMRLAPADAQLWAKILPLISKTQRFRPPRVGDIAAQVKSPDAAVRKLMKQLARMGLVIEIAEDHFFLRDTVNEMVDIVADIAAKSATGEIAAAQFRDRLEAFGEGVGRKVAIQILEFFDRAGVTLRRGDLRRINMQRRDHFRRAG
jgi:selenocysteine-specific elongation factor